MPQRIKYPRTFHLPWSKGATGDDKTHTLEIVTEMFEGKEVIVTEKLDGENTTLYPDGYTHARSRDSVSHVSRDWVRALAGQIAYDIPTGWRVCGENVYAKHSIGYDRLGSYFYVFGVYDENNCLSWADTVEYTALLGVRTVPLLYRGIWNKTAIENAWVGGSEFGDEGEGYVVRLANAFAYRDFERSVAKYVRANHVQTDTHWMRLTIRANTLK